MVHGGAHQPSSVGQNYEKMISQGGGQNVSLMLLCYQSLAEHTLDAAL